MRMFQTFLDIYFLWRLYRLLCLEKMGPKGNKIAPRQKKGDELPIPVEQASQADLFDEPVEEEEEDVPMTYALI